VVTQNIYLASLTFLGINNPILDELNTKSHLITALKAFSNSGLVTFHQILSKMDISCPLTHAKDIHAKISPVNKDTNIFLYQRTKQNKKPPKKIYIT